MVWFILSISAGQVSYFFRIKFELLLFFHSLPSEAMRMTLYEPRDESNTHIVPAMSTGLCVVPVISNGLYIVLVMSTGSYVAPWSLANMPPLSKHPLIAVTPSSCIDYKQRVRRVLSKSFYRLQFMF